MFNLRGRGNESARTSSRACPMSKNLHGRSTLEGLPEMSKNCTIWSMSTLERCMSVRIVHTRGLARDVCQ